MTATATIVLLETDLKARANNAQADLYRLLKTYADANNMQELISTLDVDYLTYDRLGHYTHPHTQENQAGMVLHVNKPMRDACMRKAASFGPVAEKASDLYARMHTEPSLGLLVEARQFIADTYATVWSLADDEAPGLCNLLNF